MSMMLKNWLGIIVLFVAGNLSAQNLVVNPDFEDCGAPWSNLDVTTLILRANVPGWIDPSGTSDYFYFSTQKRSRVLDDGSHPLQDSGVAFAGFILSENGGEEYLEGTLEMPLKKGKTYRFSVSIYDTSISNLILRIGIYFSYRQQKKLGTYGAPISLTPQIKLDSTKKMQGSRGWHTYYQDYTANGDEQYFIIGGFAQKSNADAAQDSPYGYCYVDDFSLVPADDEVPAPEIVTPPITVVQDSLIAPGKTFVTQNILFETNKSDLKDESYPTLYKILDALKSQPNLKVEIDGHTDNVGNVAANQKLSEERAKAVADFLIRNGIDSKRITWKGFGSSKPIGDDNNKNRRVEFIFSE